ncbi:hypothetical protein [Thermoflexus sp.]|uniref:hypothetical protein n=1 Tax=Thermoflexus sp. TaxID=1969742 RepID=UPI0035E40280
MGEQWRKEEPDVRAQPLNTLIAGVRLHTDILLRLRLVTTATTLGQLEMERYIRCREG